MVKTLLRINEILIQYTIHCSDTELKQIIFFER